MAILAATLLLCERSVHTIGWIMHCCTVIFDFDGTLALGRGPLYAYADCLGELTGPGVGQACRDAVDRFDAGGSGYLDAYDAVRIVGLEHGATEQQLSRAYMASRERLATDAAPIRAPAGLRDFFSRLTRIATCVVATNAPDVGIQRSLGYLGLESGVDEVHCSVGKPAGLEPIVAAHLAAGPTLSVGDIWSNDLAPAHRQGASTAFVGAGEPEGDPTMRGLTLTDLYEDILNWASQASQAAVLPAHLGNSLER